MFSTSQISAGLPSLFEIMNNSASAADDARRVEQRVAQRLAEGRMHRPNEAPHVNTPAADSSHLRSRERRLGSQLELASTLSSSMCARRHAALALLAASGGGGESSFAAMLAAAMMLMLLSVHFSVLVRAYDTRT